MQDREKEINFANIRRRLQKEIAEFVEEYSKESEVEIIALSSVCAGTCYPHTLQGHDLAFEFRFQDRQIPEHTEVVGIRIRHENWEPKITVWGHKSMMESFLCDNLTEEVKNKIMDCIDKTITQR